MIKPQRLKLSRGMNFNMQRTSETANGLPGVKIARPTEWGNLYRVSKCTEQRCDGHFAERFMIEGPRGVWMRDTRAEAHQLAVDLFAAWAEHPSQQKWLARARVGLKGKNLFCWCAVGIPCHGDILLKLVNP